MNNKNPAWIKHPAVLLSPLLIIFAGLFLAGICITLLQSFGVILPGIEGKGFSTYSELFSTRWFKQDFLFSIRVAFFSAGISIFLGVLLALGIWQLPEKLKPFSSVYKIALILPHIMVGFLVLVLFSRSGILSSILFHIQKAAGIQTGDLTPFPDVVFNQSGIGIIAAYVYKETAFAAIMLHASLRRINRNLITTAGMLGAGPLLTFKRIILPEITPTIHSTYIILFIFSFGAYDIPSIIGPSTPSVLTVKAVTDYFQRDNVYRLYALASLVFMFIFCILFVWIYFMIAGKMNARVRKI